MFEPVPLTLPALMSTHFHASDDGMRKYVIIIC